MDKNNNYKIRLISTDDEILDFEQRRSRIFRSKKIAQSIGECTYALDIKRGDMLAFVCCEGDSKVPLGGMLIELRKKCIYIRRLFVEKENRNKGVGSFMVNYVMQHKGFFEDYYAEDINGVLVEPLDTSIDFYYNNGFEPYGYQMYKRY